MRVVKNLNFRVVLFHFIIIGLFVTAPLVRYMRSENNPMVLWDSIMLFAFVPFYVFNISVLIPKLLNRGKYVLYLSILALTIVLAFILFSILFQKFGPVHNEIGSPHAFNERIPPSFRNGDSIPFEERVSPFFQKGRVRSNSIFGFRLPPFMVIFPLLIFYALGISFESIIESLKQKKSKEEVQKEKIKAELSFLKSQINPHFLFNSLNTIYSLSHSKSNLTNNAVLLLSDMMRYMLYESNGDKVPLVKEIQYIENYIALQRYRISKKDNISIRFQHTGEINNHKVEPLLFITFVENTFKHGISYKETTIINIKLSILQDKLIFETLNSCPKRNESEIDKNSSNSSGIGLSNIARRLELLYPKKHKLSYSLENSLYKTKLELILS